MNKKNRLQPDIIDQAKSANLIDYMLTYHPDKVFKHYGIRDIEHDSLVLYPDSFCRYSTMEVQDSIYYLEHYQGYRWRDAVIELSNFAKEHFENAETSSHNSRCREKNHYFFRPIATDHLDLITDYLHHERAISLDTINHLIRAGKIYAATAPGYGENYVCFANESRQFYSLRNISEDGFPKLQFSKNTDGFWWFSPLEFTNATGIFKYLKRQENLYSEELPLYICESPIDAISLYELNHENAIYTAMGGLKPNVALKIIREFSIHRDSDFRNHRRIVIATDNDGPGIKFMETFPVPHEQIHPDLKDWNEDLFYSL